MKNSLLITGFPCSERPWHNILRQDNYRHLTLASIISSCNSHDLRDMSEVVLAEISATNPRHIIAHDIGVTLTVWALFKRTRLNQKLPRSLVLFNGAFTGFDVLKARHPFMLQLKSGLQIKTELKKHGVELDLNLLPHLHLIKKMYRQVIAISLTQKFERILKIKKNKNFLPISTLILEGSDDPFIPRSSIDELENIFKDVRRIQSYQGHFPYLASTCHIYESIRQFQEGKEAF